MRTVLLPVVGGTANPPSPGGNHFVRCHFLAGVALLLLSLSAVPTADGREHKQKEDFGLGFSTEVSAPESEVLEALRAVINDGTIQGSKEYSREKYIDKADPAGSSPLFPPWDGTGKIFYKVREKVLAPTNFRESNDEGTLAVRYIVQSKDASRTILRIDAVFVEDFRRTAHPSNGSVESAEYKEVQDRIDAIELEKKQTLDAERHRQEELARQSLEQQKELEEAAALSAAQGSSENLEQHVQNLRHQLQRIIKAPGAELKAAPFHSASTLKPLAAGSDVVILVVTPYWYGVETEDGAHGWVHHSQLEPLP